MYKVKNPYKSCHIMDLNMMDISYNKKGRVSAGVMAFMISPLILAAAVWAATLMPDMGFLAECQNIPGGDICSITVK